MISWKNSLFYFLTALTSAWVRDKSPFPLFVKECFKNTSKISMPGLAHFKKKEKKYMSLLNYIFMQVIAQYDDFENEKMSVE